MPRGCYKRPPPMSKMKIHLFAAGRPGNILCITRMGFSPLIETTTCRALVTCKKCLEIIKPRG